MVAGAKVGTLTVLAGSLVLLLVVLVIPVENRWKNLAATLGENP
jgi:hypothetical protein